jgi:hypothetical protein
MVPVLARGIRHERRGVVRRFGLYCLALCVILVGASAAAGAGESAFTYSYFKTPSGNIVCFSSPNYPTGRGEQAMVLCGIHSGLRPKPPYTSGCRALRLDHNADRIGLSATGRARPAACSGDAGPFVGEAGARVLGYGRTWRVGGIRCASAPSGLTCRNKTGRGFFLSRERWRTF